MFTKKDWIIAGIFLLMSACLVFFKLDARILQDWDEGIYANIVGEMAKSGDYTHLTSGGVYWYEKEPLPFWLMAGSVNVFGSNVWALRFPIALICVFVFPLFYILARKFLPSLEAALSTILFLVSPVVWHSHFMRTADFDMMAVCLILSSLVAYLYKREKKWWLSGIFLAALCLTRGVWGFFFLAMILVLEFFQVQRWNWKKFVGLTLITVLPWLIWHLWSLSFGGTEYLRIYWQEQFFSRITGPLQGHSGSVGYYWEFLRILLGRSFLLILVLSMLVVFIRFFKKRTSENLFLPLWLVVSLAPIHIISTKLNWYIAPALPALYLSFGVFLELVKKAVMQMRFKHKEVLWGMFVGFLLLLSFGFAYLSLAKVIYYGSEELADLNQEYPAYAWYQMHNKQGLDNFK